MIEIKYIVNLTYYWWMQLAQMLYEGVILSDGKATGLITYMRTDGLHVCIDIHNIILF